MGTGSKYYSKTEGGSGGKRGHSNMAHREATAEVKKAARIARRIQARQAAADALHGIWADLPKRVQKMLLEKSYP